MIIKINFRASPFLNPQISKNIVFFHKYFSLNLLERLSRIIEKSRREKLREYDRKIMRVPGQQNALYFDPLFPTLAQMESKYENSSSLLRRFFTI